MDFQNHIRLRRIASEFSLLQTLKLKYGSNLSDFEGKTWELSKTHTNSVLLDVDWIELSITEDPFNTGNGVPRGSFLSRDVKGIEKLKQNKHLLPVFSDLTFYFKGYESQCLVENDSSVGRTATTKRLHRIKRMSLHCKWFHEAVWTFCVPREAIENNMNQIQLSLCLIFFFMRI